MTASIVDLTALGQSLWYDNIQRRLLENGALGQMIARGEIRGVTSNPSIFQNAIAKSNDYDSALLPLAWAGWDAERIFWQLAVEDIREAADLFLPLYQQTEGGDGYVSLEVSPLLAQDPDGTLEQARALWARLARPNLMVKIPATRACLPAIRAAIAEGINVNVTLIFSLERYAEVIEAYLAGLEDRAARGQPLARIASVASFFVSRLDNKIDPRLPEGSPLRGRAAIANACLAYDLFERTFAGERFARLRALGARVQRPLWASTSTKNPAYPDTLYVDNLIGADTVNTVPPATLDAFRDHGRAARSLPGDAEAALRLFDELAAAGIGLAAVTRELEDEGVQAFADAFHGLLATLDERRAAALAGLGPLAGAVADRITRLEQERFPARLWAHDASLWTDDPAGQAEISKRLGWLEAPRDAQALLPFHRGFADEVRAAGIDRCLLLGMGGSSLAPEVMALVSGAGQRFAILDSTNPAQVARAAVEFPPDRSIYLVASKSGGTAEVNALLDYFWELSGQDGARFAAITDPGTSLEKLARARGFRAVFLAEPTIGGRFSALADFGLLPAALIGLDPAQLVARADWMLRHCAADIPAARNPGLALGAVLGEAALAGRDKLTLLADPGVAPFGSWLEQLIAESSGKDGRGIVVVDGEPAGAPEAYGPDRLFVYLRQDGSLDSAVGALQAAGQPVLRFELAQPADLGAEFYRWGLAAVAACAVLGVNAFDQPDVQDNKDRTKAHIAAYQRDGRLAEVPAISPAQADALRAFLRQAAPGDYIAINAYLPRDAETSAALTGLRLALRARTGCATTVGFGPRFLHSTGQLHKGGPASGLFLQITMDPPADVDIPGQGMTFGTLEAAQALGDYEALVARGRRVVRVHLSRLGEIAGLTDAAQ